MNHNIWTTVTYFMDGRATPEALSSISPPKVMGYIAEK